MTMDPALKVAMALCVLLGGYCAASLVRRNPPRAAAPARAAVQEPRLRCCNMVPAQAAPASDVQRTSPIERPAILVKPRDDRPSLAAPAAKPREADRPAGAAWGPPIEAALPLRETVRTHRIVDGDSLEGLAERYLGSAARAGELFAANRDVLADPKLLPIGAELKIPRGY
jgi:nucleoid-associated protein YgaU